MTGLGLLRPLPIALATLTVVTGAPPATPAGMTTPLLIAHPGACGMPVNSCRRTP